LSRRLGAQIVRRSIAAMKRGSVVVDVAIDQAAASRPRVRPPIRPVYFVDGVLYYCVSNMPAAVPPTSRWR
jgi:alanine dehydrogenase